jgi:hypothetical protein
MKTPVLHTKTDVWTYFSLTSVQVNWAHIPKFHNACPSPNIVMESESGGIISMAHVACIENIRRKIWKEEDHLEDSYVYKRKTLKY